MSVRATTIAPPKNLGDLLRMSDAVVYANAQQSWSERGRTVPVTVTRFVLLRPIAGLAVPWTFEVEEVGGDFGDLHFAVAGAPRYHEGRRYLLFLDQGPNLRWRSQTMAYGQLVEDLHEARLRPLPEAEGISVVNAQGYEPPTVYRRDALLGHLEAVARGERWDAAKVTDLQAAWEEIHVNDPPNCDWLLAGDSRPIRDFDFATGGTLQIAPTTPGQTGIGDGGVSAVHAAVSAWTADAGSNIHYVRIATVPASITCTGAFDFPAGGQVVFNDPCSDIADLSGCTGTVAFGGPYFGGLQVFDSETWHDITAPFAVVNNGSECLGTTGFSEMMAHELGHSLGFGHHMDPNALMDGTLHNPAVGPILQTLDKACAHYAYPAPGSGHAPVRRQELAALMLRATGAPVGACSNGAFSDVMCAATLYAVYINYLGTNGLSAGCDAVGPRFCPQDIVTREQAAMLWLKVLEGPSTPACSDPTGYTDVTCAQPFGPWIKRLRDLGYSKGCNAPTNTLFCPKDALTYDEVALFISRALKLAPPGIP